MESFTSKANSSEESSKDISTGSSSASSQDLFDLEQSSESLAIPAMPNSLDLKRRMTTSGKKRPLLKTLGTTTLMRCICIYIYSSCSRRRFELGRKPFRRNSKRDWGAILDFAKQGRISDIDPSVVVCHYTSLKRIAQDHLVAAPMEREVHVFWGRSGLGKSRRAWDEAGFEAYPKDPRSKFWDGYRNQEHVVIDEFRGGIDVSHVLRWTDRYPVIVEVKGSSTVLVAKKLWFTSNLHPRDWYPDLDPDTLVALLRRLNITHFDEL